MNAWTFLALAIVFEVAGTTAMKVSDGFSKLWPSVFLGVFYVLSLVALALALKKIELSIAYAVWAGLGIGLVSVVGLLAFNESINSLKLVSLLFVVIGAVGLHLGDVMCNVIDHRHAQLLGSLPEKVRERLARKMREDLAVAPGVIGRGLHCPEVPLPLRRLDRGADELPVG